MAIEGGWGLEDCFVFKMRRKTKDNNARLTISIHSRLSDLRLRLQSLRRLTGVYVVKLGAVLGVDNNEIGLRSNVAQSQQVRGKTKDDYIWHNQHN